MGATCVDGVGILRAGAVRVCDGVEPPDDSSPPQRTPITVNNRPSTTTERPWVARVKYKDGVELERVISDPLHFS